MTRRILAKPGSNIAEKNSRAWTLGAKWMQDRTKALTEAEREALARALAALLERSDLPA